EAEAVRRAGVWVPIVFREGQITVGQNGFVCGNAEFLRYRALVGQIPVSNADVCRIGIVEFDGIELRRVGMGEGFVDQYTGNIRRRVVCTRRAANRRTGAPIRRIRGIRIEI